MGFRSNCHKICGVFLKILYALPVIFIVAVVLWSYYAYVVVICIFSITSIAQKVIYLILYHILLLLFMSNYLRTVFSSPIPPPVIFKLTNDQYIAALRASNDLESTKTRSNLRDYIEERNLPIKVDDVQGAPRFCVECLFIKPDRAHHCSTCGTCQLKMDHHCPWVSNCVGYHNYKFFVVFLFWGVLYCALITFSTIPSFISFMNLISVGSFEVYKFNIIFLFFTAIIFGLSQLFLLVYHLYLVSRNQTTLESFRSPNLRTYGPDPRAFDVGTTANLKQVFGDKLFYWGLPIFFDFNQGIDWPLRYDSIHDIDRDHSFSSDNYSKMESG